MTTNNTVRMKKYNRMKGSCIKLYELVGSKVTCSQGYDENVKDLM